MPRFHPVVSVVLPRQVPGVRQKMDQSQVLQIKGWLGFRFSDFARLGSLGFRRRTTLELSCGYDVLPQRVCAISSLRACQVQVVGQRESASTDTRVGVREVWCVTSTQTSLKPVNLANPLLTSVKTTRAAAQ